MSIRAAEGLNAREVAEAPIVLRAKKRLIHAKPMRVAVKKNVRTSIEQSRPGTQITVLMSFKRNGELFEQPRITFQSGDPSDAERTSYRTAMAETLKRCASLPFTEALGNALAGAPLTMRFVDDRERPPD